VDFGGDDPEAGAGKDVNDQAGPGAGKTEVIGLENDQRLLQGRSLGNVAGVVHDAAAFLAVFGPELQRLASSVEIGADEYRRFQVMGGAGGVQDVISEGIPDTLAAGRGPDRAGDVFHGLNGVFPLEQQHHDAPAAAGRGVRAILPFHIIGQERTHDRVHVRIIPDQFGVGMRQFGMGREHPRRHKIQARAADIASDHAAGPGFGNGIRIDQNKR